MRYKRLLLWIGAAFLAMAIVGALIRQHGENHLQDGMTAARHPTTDADLRLFQERAKSGYFRDYSQQRAADDLIARRRNAATR